MFWCRWGGECYGAHGVGGALVYMMWECVSVYRLGFLWCKWGEEYFGVHRVVSTSVYMWLDCFSVHGEWGRGGGGVARAYMRLGMC